jgi:hypothetical protein
MAVPLHSWLCVEPPPLQFIILHLSPRPCPSCCVSVCAYVRTRCFLFSHYYHCSSWVGGGSPNGSQLQFSSLPSIVLQSSRPIELSLSTTYLVSKIALPHHLTILRSFPYLAPSSDATGVQEKWLRSCGQWASQITTHGYSLNCWSSRTVRFSPSTVFSGFVQHHYVWLTAALLMLTFRSIVFPHLFPSPFFVCLRLVDEHCGGGLCIVLRCSFLTSGL